MSVAGEFLRAAAQYLALPLILIGAWQAALTLGPAERILPTPVEVAAALADLAFAATGAAGRYSGVLQEQALASALRVYLGFALAVVTAVPAGIAIGVSRAAERLLDPMIQIVRNVPITGFLPIAIVLFGLGDRAAVALIALAAFFPIVVNTTSGVRQIDRRILRSALMMGVGPLQRLVRVILPAASPSIFTGMRLSLGIAWVLVVVTEFIAVRSGLGYLLFDAYQFFAPAVMVATMVAIGLLGFASDRLLLLLRARVLAWERLGSLRG